MGTLTLTDFQDEIKAALGNRSDISNARLTRAVNLAQERLARRHDFEELQVTSPTTLTYTGDPTVDLYLAMPDSSPYIREIYSVVIKDGTSSQKMRRVSTRVWDRLITDPASFAGVDQPVYYQIWDYALAKAEVFPLPKKTYTVQWRLSQWPTPLSAAGDVSRLRFKDELLIELGIIYLMDSLGKESDADKHRRKFSELYAEAINTDTDKPDLDVSIGAGVGEVSPVGDYWKDPFIRSMTDGGI